MWRVNWAYHREQAGATLSRLVVYGARMLGNDIIFYRVNEFLIISEDYVAVFYAMYK